MKTDTIAAIATAMSNSGIGIIRISGDQALKTAGRIFRTPGGRSLDFEKVPSHTIHYGYIWNEDEKVDEVLLMVMKGPRSYTTEDTVEINCHGGVRMVRKILEIVIQHGARTAEPGEFTKRAFLNGRIDLSQAEAVADVISARNEYALKNSMEQLGGALSRRVKELRAQILYEIARIESALDDPEHISLDGYSDELLEKIGIISSEIEGLIRSADDGKVITEGIKTVILGKPNAGKSSLMNVLIGQERAIVTDVAGTTRDTLEEHIDLQGISLNVVDTAGIRDTEDVVERIGVERARKAAREGDLLIYVVDGSTPLDENDEEIMALIRRDPSVDEFVDKKVIVLLNKTDLKICVEKEDLEQLTGRRVIPISAKEEQGIDDLTDEIRRMFFHGELKFNEEVYITNVRHKEALHDALESLNMVRNSIIQGLPEDFYSIDLTDAYENLGKIVGESVGDDVVNEIFAKFCMGK
ncbi:MAG TPA: tRNA uridine-5-carboxymethylaminomethyl(34) synthesis GTPase MnmE [Candidatus Enterocloster excrementigallinarum]|uniref:tRNA modification GTPase MnmE n=1 Tax=Candidatus Enterocloster excrementigallinarum TaxID=2838558 RepID=A0A9D2PQ79_9FIRM|nr:tRNA uridine-5-carboxymethylaminomethyl(34) synthesis GTPase MnmE [Candidatus Enterocloster excrementigallinarum]